MNTILCISLILLCLFALGAIVGQRPHEADSPEPTTPSPQDSHATSRGGQLRHSSPRDGITAASLFPMETPEIAAILIFVLAVACVVLWAACDWYDYDSPDQPRALRGLRRRIWVYGRLHLRPCIFRARRNRWTGGTTFRTGRFAPWIRCSNPEARFEADQE